MFHGFLFGTNYFQGNRSKMKLGGPRVMGWTGDFIYGPNPVVMWRRTVRESVRPNGQMLKMGGPKPRNISLKRKKYEPHWDHQAYPGSKNQWEDNLGSRIATWLTYLSVPELGGKTCFLDLEIAAEPIKNSAVFWYNHKPSGASDDKTRHAACPVVVGTDSFWDV